MTLIIALLILIIVLGITEYFKHLYRLNQIPIRVHVNGTRGKSSLTRLIRAGLCEGGYRAMAKTTGTAPRIILEDGTETILRRKGMVSILEQIRVVAMAKKRNIEALVIECMAISPEMQFVCEHKFLRSSIGVITNIRLDHCDQMGHDLDSIAKALSWTIPENGTLVTSDHNYLNLFKETGKILNTEISVAQPYSMGEKEQGFFPFPGADQCVGQALLVCEKLGVSKKKALSGMTKALLDPGTFSIFSMGYQTHTLYLINAFAANDPLSTLMAWDYCKKVRFRQSQKNQLIVGIYVHRMDRIDRLTALAKETVKTIPFDHLLITGQGLYLARGLFINAGFPKESISLYQGYLTNPSSFVKKLIRQKIPMSEKEIVLFGFGNTKQAGNYIINYFSSHGKAIL